MKGKDKGKGKGKLLRSVLPALGTFTAVPEAFSEADLAVRNSMKFEFGVQISDEDFIGPTFSTDLALIDLAGVDSSKLDFKKMSADCDLVKGIIEKYPEQLEECLVALQSGTLSGLEKAGEITKKIGLTESSFTKSGGGFFWLAVPLVIAGLSACGGSNKVKNNKTIPTSSENPNPSEDAGPGDGGS